MVQMKREGLVLIPNISSQALESITNMTNINSPFLWIANTLLLDEAAAGADNLSEKSLYRIASFGKSLLGYFFHEAVKTLIERPHEKWRTLLEIIFFQKSPRSACEAVHHRLREITICAVCSTKIWYYCHSAIRRSMLVLRATNYYVPNSG